MKQLGELYNHLEEPTAEPLIAVEMISDAAVSASKRAMDVIVSALLLLFLAPSLLLIALLVRVTSAGPVLFRQQRTGLNGVPFTVLKFRTMYVLEDGAEVRQATRDDHRVTPVGAILRATSLDELPQLINVLRGDMSLVGPRPHAIAHDRLFGQVVESYGKRFAVRPGITGLAQIRGMRGEIRTVECIKRRLSADCEYIERWTLGTDLAILVRTLPLVVRDRNAY